MKVTLVGDIMPGRHVQRAIEACHASAARSVRDVLAAQGPAVGNLECPLSDTPPPMPFKPGGGPNLHAPVAMARWLRDAGFDALSLANNHAMDCGPGAMLQTIGALRRARIVPFGAGANLDQAIEPAFLRADGTAVAVVAFGNGVPAGAASPGVAPFRTAVMLRAVRQARLRAEAVVVLMHAGLEFHQHPETQVRQFALDALRAGAAAVIGTHPHCVRAVERLALGAVAHSLGDFISDTADTRCLGDHLERTALTLLGVGVPNPCICRQGLVAELELTAGAAALTTRPVWLGDDYLPRTPDAQRANMLDRRLKCLGALLADKNHRVGVRRIERAYKRLCGGGMARRVLSALRG
jgi:poly-gamma-glutamate synthesis protein (capsule biosynthesis protein)